MRRQREDERAGAGDAASSPPHASDRGSPSLPSSTISAEGRELRDLVPTRGRLADANNSRAALGRAPAAERQLIEVLPADALGLVLYQLTLAHDIAAVATGAGVPCALRMRGVQSRRRKAAVREILWRGRDARAAVGTTSCG